MAKCFLHTFSFSCDPYEISSLLDHAIYEMTNDDTHLNMHREEEMREMPIMIVMGGDI